jgi:hypothetical protein
MKNTILASLVNNLLDERIFADMPIIPRCGSIGFGGGTVEQPNSAKETVALP